MALFDEANLAERPATSLLGWPIAPSNDAPFKPALTYFKLRR
jgi:hypothetical protein